MFFTRAIAVQDCLKIFYFQVKEIIEHVNMLKISEVLVKRDLMQ
ncbi:hypothetical protein SAMN05660236_4861 [Ohtaekwangia koreensis]|uniref:Uncharacterized protein n=1 Tax=Ohtaekwangia koreensis TaxID=688867 RepID=A0A1T5MAB9_9BACT|nr:hypothetical protein SAMN05660236_4861 [Ohtaekwangia koreensis]